MKRFSAAILAVSAVALATVPAFAHVGHVSDLAGHSHWVGIAALGVAGLLIGIVAWKGRKSGKDASAEEAAPEDNDTADVAEISR